MASVAKKKVYPFSEIARKIISPFNCGSQMASKSFFHFLDTADSLALKIRVIALLLGSTHTLRTCKFIA